MDKEFVMFSLRLFFFCPLLLKAISRISSRAPKWNISMLRGQNTVVISFSILHFGNWIVASSSSFSSFFFFVEKFSNRKTVKYIVVVCNKSELLIYHSIRHMFVLQRNEEIAHHSRSITFWFKFGTFNFRCSSRKWGKMRLSC